MRDTNSVTYEEWLEKFEQLLLERLHLRLWCLPDVDTQMAFLSEQTPEEFLIECFDGEFGVFGREG